MAIAGVVVIQLILTKINDDDIEAVSHNLSLLPLSVIPLEKSDTLLSWFLTQAYKHDRTEIARIIVQTFDEARIRCDPLPAITQLFLNGSLPKEVLQFTLSCFPEKVPIDYYIDLVNMTGDSQALKAAATINMLFPKVSNEDWEKLVSLTENEEDDEDGYPNQLLRAFFQTKAAETSNIAVPPEWVRDFPQVEITPVPNILPPISEAIDMLMAYMAKQNLNLVSEDNGKAVDFQKQPQIREGLISQYSISMIIERIAMLAPIKQIPYFDDIPLFREFGPVNSQYTVTNQSIDPNHHCEKYGGCRMLLCTEFETTHNDGEEIDVMAMEEQIEKIDWFRSCDKCLKWISSRYCAIRRPLRHGGWKGCYCSVKCMKEGVIDPQVREMIKRIKEQLRTIGIRRR